MSKPKIDFVKVLDACVVAANEAGDKWVAEHTQPAFAVMEGNRCVGKLLDVCGFGFVQINDKRTAFAKFIKKFQNGYDNAVSINHKYRSRQEWGLNETTAYAIQKVLIDNGIKGTSVYSRID